MPDAESEKEDKKRCKQSFIEKRPLIINGVKVPIDRAHWKADVMWGKQESLGGFWEIDNGYGTCGFMDE